MEIDWLNDVDGVESMLVPATSGSSRPVATAVVVRARTARKAPRRHAIMSVPEAIRSPSIPATARTGRVNTV